MMCPGDTDFCPHNGCTTCQGELFYFQDPDHGAGKIDERDHIAWAEYVQRRRQADSEFHGHPIVPWAVEEKCYFCNYPASHKVVEDLTTISHIYHPHTAYVCCDHFWAGCQNSDAPRCPDCRHPWYSHEKEVILAPDAVLNECTAHIGQGNWCGCKEKKSRKV